MANTYSIKQPNTNLPHSYTYQLPISNGTSATTSTITSGAWISNSYGSTTNSQFHSSNHKPIMSIPHGEEKLVLEEAATLEVKGTVKINGIDLEERLKTIEKVLMIPQRDAIMEAKYPSLKKKYDEYIKALEKYTMWETIKGNEND